MITEKNIVQWAEVQTRSLLRPLGDRWSHTLGVVKKAQEAGKIFDKDEQELLIAAAYLHDIGYAPSLHQTHFHPLDGARYLLAHQQPRLASLVAYHSGAEYEANLRGLSTALRHIPLECSALADTLSYCDMTTGPRGSSISFEERLADIFQRYDEGHIVNQAMHQALPSLELAIKRTQQRFSQYKSSLHSHRKPFDPNSPTE